jgi:hypothetical protein
MKKNISTHSELAFNEAESIRILSGLLESKRTIKTFFTENDKTPNTDGYFETVDENLTPLKRFIVQIKKVDKLEKGIEGKFVDKKRYSFDTTFMCYMKYHITEEPAIYFVVELSTQKVYFIYLSDEKLKELNFEGHQHKVYYFSEDEELSDILAFSDKLKDIKNERELLRNDLKSNHSEEEISNIQEAVVYINNLFDNELYFVKEKLFPEIWRFGLFVPPNSPVYLGKPNEDGTVQELQSSKSACTFAIYPQKKGIPDYGFKEQADTNSFLFVHINMLRNIDPKEYVDSIIKNLLEIYFNNNPISIMPDEVINEILSKFIVDLRNKKMIGYSNQYSLKNINEKINLFAKTNQSDTNIFYSALDEAKKRLIDNVTVVWDYPYNIFNRNSRNDTLIIDLCEKLIQLTPDIYNKTYNSLFNTKKYYHSGLFYYNFSPFYVYKQPFLSLHYIKEENTNLVFQKTSREDLDEKKQNLKNYISYVQEGLFERVFYGNTPIFMITKALLYQGICKGLNIKCDGIDNESLKSKYFK